MPKPKQILRKLSARDGEFIFEQWAKFLTFNLLDDDILNDFQSSSRIIDNVTAEKLRCVFSQGYRFAMLQMMQSSRKIYLFAEEVNLNPEEIERLIVMIQTQKSFIKEKIEDSFLLNRTDGNERMILSRSLKIEYDNLLDKDFLYWGTKG